MEVARAENVTRGTPLAEHVERAVTARERMRGLLGRDCLPAGHGLHIAPCNAIHMFFMRFPIDVLFLDRGGRVVRAIPRLKPWRATRRYPAAHSVLELWAGAISERGVLEGDVVRLV